MTAPTPRPTLPTVPQFNATVGLRRAAIPTPLGPMVAVAGDDGLIVLDFAGERTTGEVIDRRARATGSPDRAAVVVDGDHPHLDAARRAIADYFAGRRLTIDVPLCPVGTDFERRAWAYLATIPPGETRTYGEQAAAIGSPLACRAVGRANGRNGLAIALPCHRVVGASGRLTGYGGGVERKAWLLDHERRHAGGGWAGG